MRERTDPTTRADGDDEHPAFGLISLHRVHSSPGEVLFQSDVQHPEYIVVEVHEATRKRDLKHDWVFPVRPVVKVSMSMSQFASFVSSGGTTGVPCTIEFAGSGKHEPGDRPGLNPAPRLQLTSDEVRQAADKAYQGIQEEFERYSAALEVSGPGSAAARKSALRSLHSAIVNAASNVAYAAKRLDEHAGEVVERSRSDIESMMAQMAQRLGIPLAEVLEIEEGNSDAGHR